MKPTIAVAGASGFVGKWFIEKYHHRYNIIALSRKAHLEGSRMGVTWKICDLYSLSSTYEALSGVDYALYLVHSMSPSTRLNQGTFEDTDLLLADNFARAADRCDVKHILFMGGILPDNSKLSRHLKSRFEVERTLKARKTPVTILRAGIIIGAGGSSFNIVKKLVGRLPVMACPRWCLSESQPIDVEDVLQIITKCLGNKEVQHMAIDIGGPRRISYMELLKMTAKAMSKKRLVFSVPFFTLGLSKLWVGLFSGSSPQLVSPLIESLRHEMTVQKNQHVSFDIPFTPLEDSIDKALKLKLPSAPKKELVKKIENTVRSVQRLPNPSGASVEWVASEYPGWISGVFGFLITVRQREQYLVFSTMGITLLKLQYVPQRSDDQRQLFYIIGGKLARRTDHGWLEFRSVLNNESIIAAIHEFIPRLPWIIYKATQARVHLWVMNRFGKHIQRKAA